MGKRVVVVGGGIIGLSTAYYLRKSGHDVTVLDQSDMTEGASFVNAGYIAPSHIIPLAAPGVIAQGLRWMFNPASPLYMKPRLDPAFIRWAWLFHRSANAVQVERSIPVIRDINLLSRELYEDMRTSGDLGDFQLRRDGLLMVYQTEKLAEHEIHAAEKARSVGLEVEIYDAAGVARAEPGTRIDCIGGVHYLCDRHTTPTEFMPKLIAYLRAAGVEFRTNESVLDLHADGRRLKSITTGKGPLDADEFVLAAGIWTTKLAKQLGVDVPMAAGKGYSMNVHRETGVTVPAILMEARVAVTPMNGFTRYAGTMEFSGINRVIRTRRVRAIADAAARFYPGLKIEDEVIRAAACGLRPVSPDGVPFIGRSSKVANVTFATGHAMMGWALGPATGKLATEIIDGVTTSMPIEAFSPDRRFGVRNAMPVHPVASPEAVVAS